MSIVGYYQDELVFLENIFLEQSDQRKQSDKRKRNLSHAQKLFSLPIFAFLRCFKVLDKIRLSNLSLTYMAFMVSSFQSVS